MRPGMPLGRKHFRRSRDAPIWYGKDCGQSLLSKIALSLKTSFYHNRCRTVIKLLDDVKLPGDSEGNPPAQLNPKPKERTRAISEETRLTYSFCLAWFGRGSALVLMLGKLLKSF
jgi:hypothetical protein